MNGVMILATKHIHEVSAGWAALVFSVAMAIVAVICIVELIRDEDTDYIGWIIGTVIVSIICGFLSYALLTTEYDEYIVTIDKDVKLVEFYDQYRIIKRNDDLWTIREKVK